MRILPLPFFLPSFPSDLNIFRSRLVLWANLLRRRRSSSSSSSFNPIINNVEEGRSFFKSGKGHLRSRGEGGKGVHALSLPGQILGKGHVLLVHREGRRKEFSLKVWDFAEKEKERKYIGPNCIDWLPACKERLHSQGLGMNRNNFFTWDEFACIYVEIQKGFFFLDLDLNILDVELVAERREKVGWMLITVGGNGSRRNQARRRRRKLVFFPPPPPPLPPPPCGRYQTHLCGFSFQSEREPEHHPSFSLPPSSISVRFRGLEHNSKNLFYKRK